MSHPQPSSIAVIDSSGEHRTVRCVTTPVPHRGLSSPAKFLGGSHEYFLDGQSVNKLKDGTFQVVQTDEILTPLPEHGES